MTDGTVFGLFRFEESDMIEPGVAQYTNVQLLQSIDVHEAGTRFQWATVDMNYGVVSLRGRKVTYVYRMGIEINERITLREYLEMQDGEEEEE